MRGARTIAMAAVVAMALAAPSSWAQPKKLVFWTHWEQNPEFNKFYETRGKDFAQKTGYEVQVVTVPYQGYEAKYLAALMGKSGAPDIFMGMTHHWCGQYDFCAKSLPRVSYHLLKSGFCSQCVQKTSFLPCASAGGDAASATTASTTAITRTRLLRMSAPFSAVA